MVPFQETGRCLDLLDGSIEPVRLLSAPVADDGGEHPLPPLESAAVGRGDNDLQRPVVVPAVVAADFVVLARLFADVAESLDLSRCFGGQDFFRRFESRLGFHECQLRFSDFRRCLDFRDLFVGRGDRRGRHVGRRLCRHRQCASLPGRGAERCPGRTACREGLRRRGADESESEHDDESEFHGNLLVNWRG
ncbi:MAG: hypothetical protein UU82_C0006G0029 [Candidatus Nomurabacteria bacterium GW2011_GWC2_41_8]|uniref:Uncharacterized protein n=2 Tax=Candidatus Nomuraibacteriota TaxID=1752729 RepID=A0A0G0ZQY0_9BACT|nr:MAG: hypothetical protein UU58_C0004G0014 [Candidatus Nomurabacteria bacterium GW2011_GWA2_41_25]KKS24431.1 MAG: hypothetical protein UU82_C0006G0029 [Candidatus Nomurabacteria bacterium GW2011_GWC2_41_8]